MDRLASLVIELGDGPGYSEEEELGEDVLLYGGSKDDCAEWVMCGCESVPGVSGYCDLEVRVSKRWLYRYVGRSVAVALRAPLPSSCCWGGEKVETARRASDGNGDSLRTKAGAIRKAMVGGCQWYETRRDQAG